MKTVKEEVINEIIINKSKFITILININNIENVSKIINKYQKQYKDATHYCTAYIINNHEKCDDDGEPAGTAGLPILNVLKNQNLTNVLCIVIRYFGGIKLGAGGLVRAYTKSTSEALKKAQLVSLVKGFDIEIEFNYDNIKQIDYLLNNLTVTKTFDTTIIYKFKITMDNYQQIEPILTQNATILKKEETLLTKSPMKP